jgi:hypothetical protein
VQALERGGTFVWLVMSMRSMGDVLRLAGETAEARECYLRALDLAAPHGMRVQATDALSGLAALESADERHEAALRLVSAAYTIRAGTGDVAPRRTVELEAVESRARRNLDEDAAIRATEIGRQVSLDRLDRILDR